MTFKITVEFEVEAHPIEHWRAEEVALDFLRHKLDEGLPMTEQVLGWEPISIKAAT